MAAGHLVEQSIPIKEAKGFSQFNACTIFRLLTCNRLHGLYKLVDIIDTILGFTHLGYVRESTLLLHTAHCFIKMPTSYMSEDSR